MNSTIKREGLHFTLVITSTLLLGACGSSGSTSASPTPMDLSETANSASDQVTSAAQSFDASSYALIRTKSKTSVARKIQELILPEALAATACNSGGSSIGSCPNAGPYVVERTYSDCSLADNTLSMSGTAEYTYSNAGCTVIGLTTRSVTRTSQLTMSGKSGGTLAISSANTTDYRGNTIGGGQTLTVNAIAGQYSYAAGGETRVLTTPSGTTLYSISSRTTSPITATGTSLANLVLSGGALEVIHNNSKYVLTLSANNVAFSSSCACPVSGSMTGSYSGSVSGTATITYTGCGTATMTTSGGASTSITLDACAY